MLRAAISFLVLAFIAFIFGAYGIAGLSMEIARTLLYVFLGLALISFVITLISGRSPPRIP